MLKGEHLELVGIPELRISLLVLAYFWSAYLLWHKLLQSKKTPGQQLGAWSVIMVSSSLVGLSWITMFFIW